MRQWNKKISVSKYEMSMLGMLVMTLAPALFLLRYQVRQDVLNNTMNNFRIYFVTAVVFLVMLILSAVICKKMCKDTMLSRFWYILYGGIFCIHLGMLGICYINSAGVYPHLSGEWFPWHAKPLWKIFLFMTGISIAGIAFSIWAGKKKRKFVEVIRYPVYLAASAVAGGSLYCANFMASDKMHGSAYYTSIYNALMDAPFDYSNQSIYGHYAILLKYPIKLLGGSYTAYNIVISAVGFLSVLLLAMALDMCIKNHFISMIGIWAVPVMFLYYPQNHWQMFPHRILFACVFLYLCVLYFYKFIKGMNFIGYFVCSLALLWNVETGVVCLGAWCVACIARECVFPKCAFIECTFGEYANKSEKRVVSYSWKKSILKNLAYSFISVFGMVVIFNLYNMPLGEQWHGLRFLLFPLITDWDAPEVLVVNAAGQTAFPVDNKLIDLLDRFGKGFASGLTIQLPYQISPWYLVVLLMGVAIVILIVRIMFKRVGPNDYIIGIAAVLALGNLTFFINRASFDYLAIALPEAVLIMAVLSNEEIFDNHSAWLKRPYQILFISIMAVLSVFSLWQARFRFLTRMEKGYYDQQEFDILTEDIERKVPKNTFAFGGPGIQEVYAQLGWDTGCYVVDFSSLGHTDTIGTIIVRSSEQEECLISVRNKKSAEFVTAQGFMKNWGYTEDAISIKEHWKCDVDEKWYWDIYYIAIDHSIPTSEWTEGYKEKMR